jgi:hypothetical protein
MLGLLGLVVRLFGWLIGILGLLGLVVRVIRLVDRAIRVDC